MRRTGWQSTFCVHLACGLACLMSAPDRAEAASPVGKADPSPPAETHYDSSSGCPDDDAAIHSRKEIEARDGTDMAGIFACWMADEDNDKFLNLTDYYAHWSIRQLRPAIGRQRSYQREKRSPIVRFFVGKDRSTVGSLRIDLRDPDTTFVIPLANFSYEGRAGKGEAWSTDLLSDDQTQSFFRIGPTTSARITLTAKTSTAIEVQAASTVLTALRDIASVVSPGAALVTSLNRESLQQTSRALDAALSNVWSESIGESSATARQLSEWYPGARFIIQLSIPTSVKWRLRAGEVSDPADRFTRWYELTLSCPRRSIFSSAVDCRKLDQGGSSQALRALRYTIGAPQVINFKLASGKTLQQYLSDHDWYARFLRKGDFAAGNKPQRRDAPPDTTADRSLESVLPSAATDQTPTTVATDPVKSYGAEAPGTRTESDYAAMCNSIVNALYSAGLSRLDAQIGLWAVVTGSPDFVGIEPEFQRNARCPQLLPLAGTDVAWRFAEPKP